MRLITPEWPAPESVQAISTTRQGGVSQGAWAECNLGVHCGDEPSAVAANRAALAERTPEPPRWLQQVHGRRVVHLDDWHEGIEADGAWTDRPGSVAVILSADCLPILLADRRGTLVMALHGGWRGLAAGIIPAAIESLPVSATQLLAWLGPAIGPDWFEVGAEVRSAFTRLDPAHAASFAPNAAGRFQADLKAVASRQLAAAGVGTVFDSGLCNAADAECFYSHRRDGGRTGRMATLIWLAT